MNRGYRKIFYRTVFLVMATCIIPTCLSNPHATNPKSKSAEVSDFLPDDSEHNDQSKTKSSSRNKGKSKVDSNLVSPVTTDPNALVIPLDKPIEMSADMQRIFGKPLQYTSESVTPIELPLPVSINGFPAGTHQVMVLPGNAITVERFYTEPLLKKFKTTLIDKAYDDISERISPSPVVSVQELDEAGVTTTYDISEGGVSLIVPQGWIKPSILSLGFGQDTELMPNTTSALFSGYVNTSYVKSFAPNPEGLRSANDFVSINGVISGGGVSAHTGTDILEGKARRTETALIIPWNEGLDSIWLGDTHSDLSGSVAEFPTLSGVAYFRKHNPQSAAPSLETGVFEIKNRSKIQIYKNEVPFREFERETGRFSLSDISLDSGENLVRIVITDLVTNEITEKIFQDFIPMQFVPKGEWDHSIGYGHRRTDGFSGFEYTDTPTFFGGVTYGLLKNNTVGVSLLTEENYQRSTITDRISTTAGSYSLSARQSESSKVLGYSGSVEYSKGFTKKAINNITLRQTIQGDRYKSSAGDTPVAQTTTELTAGFEPIHKIGISAGASYTSSTVKDSSLLFYGLGRGVKFSKKWAGSISAGQSWKNLGAPEAHASVTITYTDQSAENNKVVASDTESLDRSNARLSVERTEDYRLGLSSIEPRNTNLRTNNFQADKWFARGSVQGTISDFTSEERRSGTLGFSTGMAFTSETFGWTKPLSESFIIFESKAVRGAEYDVTDTSSKTLGTSGAWLRTSVIPVRNYSTVSLGSSYLDPQYFTLESSESVVYKSGFRTGTQSYLSGDENVYIMARLVDGENSVIKLTQGKLLCTKAQDTISESIFTNENGETNFYVRRGADCHLDFGNGVSETLDLSYPTKHRDLGTLIIKK
jgi:hypothetical protein